MRARILRELFDIGEDLGADARIKLFKFPKSGGRKLQAVLPHGLQAQPFFRFAEWNSPLFFGLF